MSTSRQPDLPDVIEIQQLAEHFGMSLSDEDAASYREMMRGSFLSCGRVMELDEPKPEVKYRREPGRRRVAQGRHAGECEGCRGGRVGEAVTSFAMLY